MHHEELSIVEEWVDDIAMVHVTGPVDSETFGEFKEALEPLYLSDCPKIIVDCRRLSYINSKGIGLLALAHRRTLMHGGQLALFGLNPVIRQTLDLLGLATRLHLFDDQKSAVHSVASLNGASR